MKVHRVLVAGFVLILTCSIAFARRPHNQQQGSVSPRLAGEHLRHVAESVNRYLDSGLLSPAQELASRAGLEAFLISRAAGERDSSPDLPSSELDMQATPELLEATGFNIEATSGLTALPSGLNSIGLVACTVGDELLVNGRFIIAVSYQGYSGPIFRAYSCRMTNSAGYFFWSDRTNAEIPVKMLDACAWGNPGGHWVFAAGLTDFAVALTVFDAATGASRTYTNSLGHTFNTVIDQSTPFRCP